MKAIRDFAVVENKWLNFEYFTLTLHCDEPLPQIMPGQFVEVKVSNCGNAFLRRPVSIHDVDYDSNTIKLLIQQRGEATVRLSEARVGDEINMIFPLGNGFSMPNGKKVLLVGGGCGIAPFLYFSRYLINRGYEVDVLYGMRSNKFLFDMSSYEQFVPLHITTDDGSFGKQGLVTEHDLMTSNIGLFSEIYCCGPEPMMKAVARIAIQNDIACEVSLENMMACGIGACLCCVTDTKVGHKCVCSDGPVFDAKELKWF